MWKYLLNNDSDMSKSNFEYKMIHSYDQRKLESTHIRTKYPKYLPVILEKGKKSADLSLPDLQKNKFLIPVDLTVGQFIMSLRKQLKMNNSQTVFLFVNNYIIPQISTSFLDVYKKYSDNDGFLYVTYATENVFG